MHFTRCTDTPLVIHCGAGDNRRPGALPLATRAAMPSAPEPTGSGDLTPLVAVADTTTTPIQTVPTSSADEAGSSPAMVTATPASPEAPSPPSSSFAADLSDATETAAFDAVDVSDTAVDAVAVSSEQNMTARGRATRHHKKARPVYSDSDDDDAAAYAGADDAVSDSDDESSLAKILGLSSATASVPASASASAPPEGVSFEPAVTIAEALETLEPVAGDAGDGVEEGETGAGMGGDGAEGDKVGARAVQVNTG